MQPGSCLVAYLEIELNKVEFTYFPWIQTCVCVCVGVCVCACVCAFVLSIFQCGSQVTKNNCGTTDNEAKAEARNYVVVCNVYAMFCT